MRRRVYAVTAAIAIAAMTSCPARAQSPAPVATPDKPGYCNVKVAQVVPADAAGTTQAVLLAPAEPGSGTVSGSIALFTTDDVRYDVTFPATPVGSDGPPHLLLYRFARPVKITGAYVASLGSTAIGTCIPSDPWTTRFPPAKIVTDTIAGLPPDAPAIAVTGPAVPDPLVCAVPFQPARTLHAAPLRNIRANARITVLISLLPDGTPFEASIAKVTNTDFRYDDATKKAALAAAAASTYETEIFRCRHVAGTYNFIVEYSAPGT